jgi:plasmid stabilization system protein ParE
VTFPVLFRDPARREFNAAALRYEAQRPGLGLEFVAEVERAVRLAATSPGQFAKVHGAVRRIPLRRFPFSIFFCAERHRTVILAIFHARRDPAVWKERV